MSVVFTSDVGVVLDHQQLVTGCKAQVKILMNNKEEKLDLQMNSSAQQGEINQDINTMFDDLFDLRTPFLMDGEAKKIADKMDGNDLVKAKKKKKQKLDMSSSENAACSPSIAAEVRHVREVYETLQGTSFFKKHFSFIPTSQDFRENNRKVREARKYCIEASKHALPTMDETNDGGLKLKIIQDHTYVIPAKTRFICDDVQNLRQYCLQKIDLIVMDPPWWNGYVRRRNKNHGMHHGYDMLSVEDILSIPVKEVLNENSLVAIWCTNSTSIIDEFLKGLKAAWNVDLCATWYWLKVSKSGAPISSLDDSKFSHSKRPYERILLAKRSKSKARSTSDGLSEAHLHPAISNINPPKEKIICSVPSGMHSHKPYLGDLLLPYVQNSFTNVATEVNCLELFARSLYPGWTSYGREVLKLQHTCLNTDSNF